MRERAEGIGAGFNVWSHSEAGTEVELSVPGHVAYQPGTSGHRANIWARLLPRRASAKIKGDQTRRDE
jgi:hypothetical protein